jgi:hypothetical protein
MDRLMRDAELAAKKAEDRKPKDTDIVWVHHAKEASKKVTRLEAEKLYKQGWANTPAKFKKGGEPEEKPELTEGQEALKKLNQEVLVETQAINAIKSKDGVREYAEKAYPEAFKKMEGIDNLTSLKNILIEGVQEQAEKAKAEILEEG